MMAVRARKMQHVKADICVTSLFSTAQGLNAPIVNEISTARSTLLAWAACSSHYSYNFLLAPRLSIVPITGSYLQVHYKAQFISCVPRQGVMQHA